MKEIDVIILSYMKSAREYKLTLDCINSLRCNTIESNIILIETNPKIKNYKNSFNEDVLIIPEIEFNYNKFINIGLQKTKTNYILISNNDVIYDKNCLSILKQKLDEKYDSVSPTTKYIDNDIEGYEVGKIVTGWSIMFKKQILDKIGYFDERFTFWYQDNDYSNWLKKCRLKHALIKNAYINHLSGQSHHLLNGEELYNKTHGLTKIFENKWKNWDEVKPYLIQENK